MESKAALVEPLCENYFHLSVHKETTNNHCFASDLVSMIGYALNVFTLAYTSTGEVAVVPLGFATGDHVIHYRIALALYVLRPNSHPETYGPVGSAYLENWTRDAADEHE